MIPGEIITADGDITLNEGVDAVTLTSAGVYDAYVALLAEGTAARSAEPEPEEEPEHPALKHPTVQAALDIFGGTVESIDEGER